MTAPLPDRTGRPLVLEEYRRHLRLRGARLLVLLALLGLLTLVALSLGSGVPLVASWMALLGRGAESELLVVWQIRLPRVLMGLLVGAALAMGGTVCQATLRNPLASPFTLGLASGAALGAVLAIVAGGPPAAVAGAGFVCALLTTAAVVGVSRLPGATSETLILAGVALMFFFSAITSLLQYLGTMEQVHAIVFWMFGSLSRATWGELLFVCPLTALPGVALLTRAWDLNLLAAGDEVARSVGVDADRARALGLGLASLMCAGAIAFTGVIGFVGLVAPHIGRMTLGNDHRLLVPGSALLGSVLVLAADTAGRTLWAPRIIPIGIMTSFIGVPFFVYLLVSRRRSV